MHTFRDWNFHLNQATNTLIPEALHPNNPTYMRLIAVPILVLFNSYKPQCTWMFIIVLLAFLMGFFDGATAMNRYRVTRLGTVLNPIADKLLALTALTILLCGGIVHWTVILMDVSRGGPLRYPSGLWVFQEARGRARESIQRLDTEGQAKYLR